MSALLKQIANSKKTVIERFRKLYRTIYIQFIQFDTMHKKDLQKIIEALNLRITTLETTMNANFITTNASIGLAILAHVHPGLPGPPGSFVGPGVGAPAVPPAPSVTTGMEAQINSISNGEPAQKSKTSTLLGEGPATAPYADGFLVPEIAAANITGAADVGLGG